MNRTAFFVSERSGEDETYCQVVALSKGMYVCICLLLLSQLKRQQTIRKQRKTHLSVCIPLDDRRNELHNICPPLELFVSSFAFRSVRTSLLASCFYQSKCELCWFQAATSIEKDALECNQLNQTRAIWFSRLSAIGSSVHAANCKLELARLNALVKQTFKCFRCALTQSEMAVVVEGALFA